MPDQDVAQAIRTLIRHNFEGTDTYFLYKNLQKKLSQKEVDYAKKNKGNSEVVIRAERRTILWDEVWESLKKHQILEHPAFVNKNKPDGWLMKNRDKQWEYMGTFWLERTTCSCSLYKSTGWFHTFRHKLHPVRNYGALRFYSNLLNDLEE